MLCTFKKPTILEPMLIALFIKGVDESQGTVFPISQNG